MKNILEDQEILLKEGDNRFYIGYDRAGIVGIEVENLMPVQETVQTIHCDCITRKKEFHSKYICRYSVLYFIGSYELS